MIKLLSKSVADKIAAGEVVDRPLSIVKELVENSIDAGADSITVEIRNGGKNYIRVTDNGSGISQEEAEMAFLRHATSKIATDEDLNSILTLGFRGEALSSIAAVSRVELITKTADEKTGISLKINGGEVFEKNLTGCPEGTTIIVSDLFYNTPARLKFMKTDSAESNLIIDFMSKIALAYSDIKIRLINNGNILFSTNGKGDRYTSILTVYSRSVGEGLMYLKSENERMKLEGYISRPDYSKTNKRQQIFFVNGRVISNKVMDIAVQEGYTERLFEGRYPIAFLFFTIQPNLVDVNIHPNKKEVRFHDDMEVKIFISQSIKRALLSKEAIPPIQKNFTSEATLFSEKPKTALSEPLAEKGPSDVFRAQTEKEEVQVPNTAPMSIKSVAQKQVNVQIQDKLSENRTEIKAEENKQEQVDIKLILSSLAKERQEAYDGTVGTPVNIEVEPEVVEKKKVSFFGSLQLTGTVFHTYITAVDENSFYFIDQHAAHERIFYEQLLHQYKAEEKLQQTILIPIVAEANYAIKSSESSWVHLLQAMGFDIEAFGTKSYIIKAIPMFMEMEEANQFIDYFLENIEENVDIENASKIDKIIMRACKSAVKAHDVLSDEECRQLIADLAKCENPYSCPHGRPTFIKMTQYELEKMFKRV
ncbi:DNA mismatch repair endonuclease MutL [Clostridium aminobutyricum]|uniref:DNA mismatch repair protein MutL n=1 Tax=Clostridium aminobutyricum TaxID=33953 RepID=A0A939D7I0_CLOAM|nr:DNA mismatch repair endonuclease MutL [Clostridium aminobutyricum]MBN7772516.1 DNA mismatch repair endonuclease MutL [Clostridium aminobutyricum]